MKTVLTFDIECYANYFLALFRNPITEKITSFQMYNDAKDYDTSDLKRLLASEITLITFNGLNYDLLILEAAIKGASNYELKKLSDLIIRDRLMPWVARSRFTLEQTTTDHVDLIQVAFGTASLKVYGARLGSRLLQELPIHYNNIIMPDEVTTLYQYCINDNIVTNDLLIELGDQIKIREDMNEKYHIDLRSKSDAQVADAVFKSEYKRLTGNDLKKPKVQSSYKYIAPDFIFFQTEKMQNFLSVCQSVDIDIESNGSPRCPKELNTKLQFADKKFKFGVGGLHSDDEGCSYYSNDEYQIKEYDFSAFYPNIILNSGFEPDHMGSIFTEIYQKLVDTRNDAKAEIKRLNKEIKELEVLLC